METESLIITMTEEIWKPIEGYEGQYEISSYGRVKSLKRPYENNGGIQWTKERILSPGKDKDGYLQVNLHCNGKQHQRKIHRLVAQAFLPNPDNLPMVNHKDEDKTNNNVDNLEWCDHRYNMNYGSCIDRAIETRLKNGFIKRTYPQLRNLLKENIKLYKHITYKIRRGDYEMD